MLNFSENIQEIIAKQPSASAKAANFTTFGSKKALLAAEILPEKVAQAMAGLKYAYNFTLHNDKKYLIVQAWEKGADKPYYMVVNTETMQVAQVENITKAKSAVLAEVAKEALTLVNEKAPDAAPAPEVELAQEKGKKTETKKEAKTA